MADRCRIGELRFGDPRGDLVERRGIELARGARLRFLDAPSIAIGW